MLCSGEQILKRGYKNSETETIACSWIKFLHCTNSTTVTLEKRHIRSRNEEETLPRNNPRPVIIGLEERNLEDDIALHHGHVTYPRPRPTRKHLEIRHKSAKPWKCYYTPAHIQSYDIEARSTHGNTSTQQTHEETSRDTTQEVSQAIETRLPPAHVQSYDTKASQPTETLYATAHALLLRGLKPRRQHHPPPWTRSRTQKPRSTTRHCCHRPSMSLEDLRTSTMKVD